MIDLYCERLHAGLWAEPINALTNLVFIFASLAIWQQAHRRNSLSLHIRVLIGLMAAIGIGSGLFHTFATRWAQLLDIIPILLFQLAFLWIYGQQVIKLSTRTLAALVVAFLVFAYFCLQFPHLLNGSLGYAPALVLLLGSAFYHYYHAQREQTLLLWATGVFGLSLFFRTIDMASCVYTPFGTHFLWHLFNGLLIYLIARSVLMNLPTRRTK